MIHEIQKPKASERMVRIAVALRGVADMADAGQLDSICLVFVERGPDRFVTTRTAFDQGHFTLLGGLAVAQAEIISKEGL